MLNRDESKRVTFAHLKFLLGTSILSTALVASPVAAQSGDMVEEREPNVIVVTARKRAESLQDVPLAVTAIDAKALEKSFANTVDELERFAPNVELGSTSFAAKSLTATIRGVGFADVEKSFEPAVGFSIDGVFLGTSGGAAIDVFDIESVEILRGPQGTLYGRNTVGGVINIKRTSPTEDPGLRAKMRFGNHGREEYLAVANTGRFGAFALKGYFFKTLSDTFATNIVTGHKEKFVDNMSFGGALSYDAGGSVTGTISVDRFVDDSGQGPVYNLSQPGATFCDLTLIPFVDLSVSAGAGCSGASYDIAAGSDFKQYVRALPVQNSMKGFSVTANFDWEISDNLTVTSVTGYRESDETLETDNLGAPLVTLGPLAGPGAGAVVPLYYASRNIAQKQISQELRLSGTAGDNVDFVTGLFFMDSDYTSLGGPGPGGVGFGSSFAFGAPSNNATVFQNTEAYAAFADGTYRFNDNFAVSAGIRYSYEKKDFFYDFILSNEAGITGQVVNTSANFDNITGRIILQYDFSDDVMVFGGWSRGFRSGGFNGRATTPTSVGPYDPETVDSFEAGMRMEMFDNMVRFNPTVFYAKYKDKQEEISRVAGELGTSTETVVQNAASANIWGIELEMQAQPTDNLNFRASAGYLNAKYGKFFAPDPAAADPSTAPIIDVSDNRQLRRAPKWTFAVGGTYTQPVTDTINVIATVDYSYIDKFAVNLTKDATGLGRDIIGGAGSLDFTLGIESNKSSGMNWSLTAYVKDAIDSRAGRLSTTLDVGAFYFGAGVATTLYGLELGLEF